jgi:GGDEF domain-containing protein
LSDFPSLDSLTGLYRADQGLKELEREVARAGRLAQQLAVAVVTVELPVAPLHDHPETAAVEATVLAVARTLQRELRVYDLIFRHSETEIVCVLPGLSAVAASGRLELLASARAPEGLPVTIALAELARDDSPLGLLDRAGATRRPARHADG